MPHTKLGVYISWLLRHRPDALDLRMDSHGWVDAQELIDKINQEGRCRITMELLDEVVRTDDKGRFRFDEAHGKIKACQGHSIPWVEPELTITPPPTVLYHGTTAKAYQQIVQSGALLRMSRHAVHMQADAKKAWTSATRWQGQIPVLLEIDASAMTADGFTFGVTENGVWCTERVPVEYVRTVHVDDVADVPEI